MDALDRRIDNLEGSINNVVGNLSGSVNNIEDNMNRIVDKMNNYHREDHPIKVTTFSYANSLDSLVSLETTFENNPNLVTFSLLKELVVPNTDTKLGEGNIISVTGTSYGVAFDETYTIHLSNGDNLQFSGLYANTGSGVETADSKVKFGVTTATGDLKGAFEVEVEYTSNQYKSRIIKVFSR